FDRDGSSTVVDGPFAETKELVAGFWLLEVSSREEVIEWVRKAPFRDGEVEIRQVFSNDDFGDALTPELREQEDRLRAAVEARHGSN
ncbi:MAG: YciI family protein, partial [Actinomycetes bacterium]